MKPNIPVVKDTVNESAVIVAPVSQPLAENYMPIFALTEHIKRRQYTSQFTREAMREGTDFTAAAPGSGRLPTLLKPGAEKLCTYFGLTPDFKITEQITDWTGREYGSPLFSYTTECTLWRGDLKICSASANCNSWETRYHYRYVTQDQIPPGTDLSTLHRRETLLEEFQFALDKRQTSGPYGKPKEYWEMFDEAIKSGRAERIVKETKNGARYPAWRIAGTEFRILNPDPWESVNVCLKMSAKRAMVAAILIAIGISDLFSQDVGDDEEDGKHPAPPPPPPPPDEPRQTTGRQPEQPLPMEKQQQVPEQPEYQQTPEGLAKLWSRMAAGSREEKLEEFSRLKHELIEAIGDDAGLAVYYGVLREHGVEHASEFKSLLKARAAATELWSRLNPQS